MEYQLHQTSHKPSREVYKGKKNRLIVSARNKAVLSEYDNQIDLNFGLMKLCVGEFECELARNNQ